VEVGGLMINHREMTGRMRLNTITYGIFRKTRVIVEVEETYSGEYDDSDGGRCNSKPYSGVLWRPAEVHEIARIKVEEQ